MDKMLFDSRHMVLYFSTLNIGLGIIAVPKYRSLHIHLIFLELILLGEI